jgi:Icc-related predicted phosphoesterase
MKYLWLTDIHLNFLTKNKLVEFCIDLEKHNADGIFITGDISTGSKLIKHLKYMDKIISCPIYFTIGNHDIYGKYIEELKKELSDLNNTHPKLNYLTSMEEVIEIGDNIGLIGDDGWYDGRFAEPLTNLVFSFDWFFIKDFRDCKDNKTRLRLMRSLADESAKNIIRKLRKAYEKYDTVYLLTHIPPFPQTYKIGIENRFWTPYNSSKILVDFLDSVFMDFPDKKLVILAGHVHLRRKEIINKNIELRVGDAMAGFPKIESIIYVNSSQISE